METLNQELQNYRQIFYHELHDNILSYWIKYSLENEGNGFFGAVDMDGNPVITANKTSVLNARILWTFTSASKMFKNEEYAAIADKAYRVIVEDFADKENGGCFMELSSENIVCNDIKHIYAQAFVIYSLCEYYEFLQLNSVMKIIQEFFVLIEEKTKDNENIDYLESFTRDWKICEENRMTDHNEPKSMNTHLHILEAYTAVYKIWKNRLVKQRLTELINLFIEKIFDIYHNKAVLIGNIDPSGVLSYGTVEDVSNKTLELLEIYKDSNKFILNAGCAIPAETTSDNLKAMIKVAREF